MKRGLPILLVWALAIFLAASKTYAAERTYVLSGQFQSFAPNAGGQQAYGLKLLTGNYEFGAFQNSYLMVGNKPLLGGNIDFRFPFCSKNCFWEVFAQVGAGASTAGPLLESTWGAVIPLLPLWLKGPAPRYIPALRLDLTTQLIFIQWRGITWSYPLWAGLSIPF